MRTVVQHFVMTAYPHSRLLRITLRKLTCWLVTLLVLDRQHICYCSAEWDTAPVRMTLAQSELLALQRPTLMIPDTAPQRAACVSEPNLGMDGAKLHDLPRVPTLFCTAVLHNHCC